MVACYMLFVENVEEKLRKAHTYACIVQTRLIDYFSDAKKKNCITKIIYFQYLETLFS